MDRRGRDIRGLEQSECIIQMYEIVKEQISLIKKLWIFVIVTES